MSLDDQCVCAGRRLLKSSRSQGKTRTTGTGEDPKVDGLGPCLLYTSDAADERSSVDLGGRRIIKKKKTLKLGTLGDSANTQNTVHNDKKQRNN